MEVAGALLGSAIEVVVARDAELRGAIDERLDQRMALADRFDRQAGERLGEIGKGVVPAPAGRAARFPAVEVLRLAVDLDQAVDRARAAEHAPARRIDPA